MFERAIAEMHAGVKLAFGPVSFRNYVRGTADEGAMPAPWIAKDSLDSLAPELRSAKTMVFRLGSPSGEKHTHFALAKCIGDWSDYFLLDNILFRETAPNFFLPSVAEDALFAFQVFPKLTESSIVNLAVATGLLGTALALDHPNQVVIPVTGMSTFTFLVTPHSKIGVSWNHTKGQIEIDAVFVGMRQERPSLFVVEAKFGTRSTSLAKHKLAYSALAMKTTTPPHLPIIPVYLRAFRVNDDLHYQICECAPIGNENESLVIADIKPTRTAHLLLRGY